MMGFTWFMIGVAVAATGFGFYFAEEKNRLTWMERGWIVAGIALLLFAAAWAAASVAEGVPRSASMGILLFASPGVVILTTGIRRIKARMGDRA